MYPAHFEPSIGMRAIVESLTECTSLTNREAWGFMVPCDPDAYDAALKKLRANHRFDPVFEQPDANAEFWERMGFTPEYVVDQIEKNC